MIDVFWEALSNIHDTKDLIVSDSLYSAKIAIGMGDAEAMDKLNTMPMREETYAG